MSFGISFFFMMMQKCKPITKKKKRLKVFIYDYVYFKENLIFIFLLQKYELNIIVYCPFVTLFILLFQPISPEDIYTKENVKEYATHPFIYDGGGYDLFFSYS